MMKFIDAVSRALTGRRSQTVTSKSILDTSKKAYGDRSWKELARETGISERTMRRIRAGGRPSKQTQAKLDALGKQREVRQAAMKPKYRKKLDQAATQGTNIKVKGHQGPPGKGAGDYRRDRLVQCFLPGEVMEDIRGAYEEGDDERAGELLQDAIAEHGWPTWSPGGWEIGNVDELNFE